MHPLRLRLALGFLALSVWGASAATRATPIVYASVPDDGSDRGIVSLAPASGTVSLGLYLDPGELALEYVVGFEATAGLVLEGFSAQNPSATVNFDATGGTLAITDSLGAGSASRVRIGSLVLRPLQAGGELRLVDLPNASFPALTNANFELTIIPVPRTLALVPEPAVLAPVWLAGLVVARALRRARPAGR